MKLLLIAALAILASAHAEEKTEPGHRYMYFPDGDGVPHLIDLDEKYEPWTPEQTRVNLGTITFNLFTRQNPSHGQRIMLNSVSTIQSSNFRANRPTRFVTHGWRSNQFSTACIAPRDAYLRAGDYNVIVVDWGSIAGTVYSAAAGNVRNVAGHVAQFMNFMNRQGGLNFGTTQMIGHSLGGHVASLAARGATGTVQAVVALDPANPGFEHAGAGAGVHPTDAANVQVIHTNAGGLGLARTAGDSDFYPNGGTRQPGCGTDIAGTCAHSRAYYFFAESIGNPNGFRALENRNVLMGGRSLTPSRGRFTVNTRDRAPFAMG